MLILRGVDRKIGTEKMSNANLPTHSHTQSLEMLLYLKRQYIIKTMASDMCGRPNCGPCVQPGGMSGSKHCQKPNVVYEYSCQFPSCDAVYVGETSKNLYTRDSQHQYNYTGGPNGNRKLPEKSFIFQHQASKHGSQEANFKRKVLHYYEDCLSRQASEAIFISKINGEILNNKSEFHQPATVTIRREVTRGL